MLKYVNRDMTILLNYKIHNVINISIKNIVDNVQIENIISYKKK